MILEILFICFFSVVIYSYLIYPVIVWIISKFKQSINPLNYCPSVSILLAVYNEENVIRERIKNISDLVYDLNLVEVLVGSDGSTDRTNHILRELEKEYSWLNVYLYSERRGKALMLNDLMDKSKNEIIVFSDANSLFHNDALNKLMQNFSDNLVGGVSGRLILVEPDKSWSESNEERRYWEYETFIKIAEGRCGSLIGANGGIYAIRRMLLEKFPKQQALTDDLYLTLTTLKKGKKFCYDKNAVAVEEIAPSVQNEFHRKVRFSATNFNTLKYFGLILSGVEMQTNFFYFSHKILRWCIPFLLLPITITNLFIIKNSELFFITMIFQAIFILFAIIGFLLSILKVRLAVFSIPYFFMLTNCAIILGFINFIRGKQSGVWQPTER